MTTHVVVRLKLFRLKGPVDATQSAMFVEELRAVISSGLTLDIWGQKDYNAVMYFIDGGSLCN